MGIFSKEDTQVTTKCSTSLTIRKMQIKTMMKYHLISVRMAIIKRQQTSVGQDEEKRESSHTVGEMQVDSASIENTWSFLKKLKME